MTAVLISIKPKWCELIANGQKTVEVRKSRPKLETPFKVYIYCTKPKEKLIDVLKDGDVLYGETYHGKQVFIKVDKDSVDMLGKNQKVIGEFLCNKITPFTHGVDEDGEEYYETGYVGCKECMGFDEIKKYLGEGKGYGWHISDLKIYDKPKGLHHFFKPCGDCDKKGTKRCTEELSYCRAKVITRPPQSWCYVRDDMLHTTDCISAADCRNSPAGNHK